MSQILIKRGYQQAKLLLRIQFLLILVIAGLGWLQEFKVAAALLSGGIAVLVANLYFVHKAFSKSGAQASKQVLGAFYFGESVKIILSAVLIIVGFILSPDFELYVLVGYIAALLAQWLAPIIITTH